jgi:hypothetical protein
MEMIKGPPAEGFVYVEENIKSAELVVFNSTRNITLDAEPRSLFECCRGVGGAFGAIE